MSSKRAKKSNEIVSLILNDPQLIPHLDKFSIEVTNTDSKQQHPSTSIIPFTQRATVPHVRYTKIKFDRHVVWEKGRQSDSFADGTLPLLLQLTLGQCEWKHLPCTLTRTNLDQCIKQFLIDGYMVIPPDVLSVPQEMHNEILQLGLIVENHISSKIPLIDQIFEDLAVKQVLSRLLGSNYQKLDTTHMHLSSKGRKEQHWHKDNFNNYTRALQPRSDLYNVMAMYYAQDTVVEMGPTAIRRGSHYTNYNTDYLPDRLVFEENPKFYEMNLTCKAGSIVLMHYDLAHRRVKNTLTERFMIKFQFKRAVEPSDDQLPNVPDYEDVPVLESNYDASIDPLAKPIWNWLHGKPVTAQQ